jgi:hypothetical protein
VGMLCLLLLASDAKESCLQASSLFAAQQGLPCWIQCIVKRTAIVTEQRRLLCGLQVVSQSDGSIDFRCALPAVVLPYRTMTVLHVC